MWCRHSSTQLVFNQLDPNRTHEMGKEKSKETEKEIGQPPQKDQREAKQTGLRKREVGQKEKKKAGWASYRVEYLFQGVENDDLWVIVVPLCFSMHTLHTHTTIRATPSASPSKYHGQQTRPMAMMNLCIMGNRPGPWPWWTSVSWATDQAHGHDEPLFCDPCSSTPTQSCLSCQVGVCYKNHHLCGTPCPTTPSSQHNICTYNYNI